MKRKNTSYRTSSSAGPHVTMPERLALITHPDYQSALSFWKRQHIKDGESSAHLQAVCQQALPSNKDSSDLEVRIEGDKVLLGDYPAVDADFRDLSTDNSIHDLNLGLLMAVYSVLLHAIDPESIDSDGMQDLIETDVDIYLPDFMAFITGSRKYSRLQVEAVLDGLKKYHNVIGVINHWDRGLLRTDRFLLLIVHNVKETTNTIRISSPYMTELIRRLIHMRVKRDGKGKPVMHKGQEVSIPNYSYLIKGTIVTARCTRAAEIVSIIVTLIEQTGCHGTPHISAKELINRCPSLKVALESCKFDSEKNKLLERTFKAVWRYIEVYTDLHIEVRPMITPQMNSLKTVYEFKSIASEKEQEDQFSIKYGELSE